MRQFSYAEELKTAERDERESSSSERDLEREGERVPYSLELKFSS